MQDWAYLQKYSAYHNIDPSGETRYPPLLMTTSTKDDRVHPYHARCFVARLLDVQTKSAEKKNGNDNNDGDGDRVFYYENIEGGHGGAADNPQQAFMNVMYQKSRYLCFIFIFIFMM
jgi:prolyl oligopeptidase